MRRILASFFCVALILCTTAISFAAVGVPGGTPDYFNSPNWANSPLLRKFVDSLSPLGCTVKNNLNQCIPIANPDTISFPGTDYYEIELREYTEQMHSDLPATKLRGYVQTNNGTDATGFNTITPATIHYLGPLISAKKDRPVRIKFTNMLPTGLNGNLFIPVDSSVMGAGMGPQGMGAADYTQNRATLHLHGGHTPWISDGTPHQWITPAGESTAYPRGVSVQDVPDMPASASGSQTFFYTNQQSARLMFYHDHAYGITRLNVYAGEAAGYLISDPTEENLITTGAIPADQIPLIIQDKTFVPTTVNTTDPTWDSAKWGGYGNLWFPHVYMPNQNPNDITGANPFGRWDYGPWFWPPLTVAAGLQHGPIIDPVTGFQTPGVPDVSMVMEAFMDTPLVNGTAYPFLDVQPKAYRFRILNACNDRFLNLSLFYVDPANPTEVKMVPATPNPAIPFPTEWLFQTPGMTPDVLDGRIGGVPDPAKIGPAMIQIGTEGGFLPAPVVLPNIPIGYVRNTRDIVVGNVSTHNLFLGPAERADVIVDFSQVPAGSKIILYNDSPAPVPAGDPRLDYYTGNPDFTSTGGAPSTLVGFGPNMRTIMQFRISGTAAAPFNLAALQAALPSAFLAAQPVHIVPQKAYGDATDTYSKIADTQLTFTPTGSATPVTLTMEPKTIQELFEKDYGRMNSTLGTELPLTNFLTQTTIPLGYIDPPTEILSDGQSQLWKITHNGVDTHAIHFHLMDAQLVNRVGWDGAIRLPDANELGWKDTVRMNPLEDAIVALRPTTPKVPFVVPNSSRLLDPTQLPDSMMGFTQIDPATGLPKMVMNVLTDFGWEYVWHCHLLGHEEMDMMRPVVFNPGPTTGYVIPNPPGSVVATPGNAKATVSFTAPTANGGSALTSYLVTSNPGGFTATKATSPITIIGLTNGTPYTFTVAAINSAGTGLSSLPSNAVTPSGPALNYTISVTTGPNGIASPTGNVIKVQGSSQTITFTPDVGYHVASVVVDGVSVGNVASYTFTNIAINHTVVASFAINTYTLTATTNAGGTISPTGVTTVNYGTSQSFTISPTAGYYVASLLVDGVSIAPAASYSFTGITANHTIAVTYSNVYYSVAASATGNGTISPVGTTQYTAGSSAVYSFTANTGSHIGSVVVDGTPVAIAPTYTFTNLAVSHTIVVTFVLDSYSLTLTASAGGYFSPSGGTLIYGVNATFNIIANTGYHIVDVKDNGISVGAVSTYTITNPTSGHTLNATFSNSMPVYRFRNLKTSGLYFYTINTAEKNSFVANGAATWMYEGVAYYAHQTPQQNTTPVYRFRNLTTSGLYFYTASSAEKNSFVSNGANTWFYEGIAYHVTLN